MKKLIVIALAALAVCSFGACSFSFSTSETKTTTDANGKTTTVTTTTTSSNTKTAAEAAEDGEVHKADLTFENNTKSDIEEIYIAAPEADTWGENLLEEPIEAGEDSFFRDITMSYNADALNWEIKVVDSDGNSHEFDDWDLSNCNSENMTVEFSVDDDGSWMYRSY